jgi:tripartite-type tricarboxylate transporter receptor subunit TctC
MTTNRRAFIAGCAALAAAGGTGPALAQADIVRLVVPFAPGGTSDIVARLLAAHAGPLASRLVVDNRAGASGAIGLRTVAAASSDGRTLLLGNISTQAIAPHLHADKGYPGLGAFTPVALTGRTTNLIAVHPGTGIRDWADFARHMRRASTPATYATGSNGGSPHLSFELLRQRMGWKAQHVAYKGAGPMIGDLLGGHVQIAIDNLPALLPHVQRGALTPIAVTSARRWPGAEQIPTLAELGVKDYDVTAWFGVFGPAGMSAATADPIARAFVEAQQTEAVRERFAALGAVADPLTGEAFARVLKAQSVLWRDVIREGDIRGS